MKHNFHNQVENPLELHLVQFNYSLSLTTCPSRPVQPPELPDRPTGPFRYELCAQTKMRSYLQASKEARRPHCTSIPNNSKVNADKHSRSRVAIRFELWIKREAITACSITAIQNEAYGNMHECKEWIIDYHIIRLKSLTPPAAATPPRSSRPDNKSKLNKRYCRFEEND